MSSRPIFELSLAELDFARRMGPRYSIYRVYSAGGPDVSVSQLHDPARQLSVGGLQLYVGSTSASA